uniref:DDE-1 domain-containing protein n=1 Tax=Amphimedon queenslandica TaxID=400682 RepID=A0A1X7UK18_AMPQE
MGYVKQKANTKMSVKSDDFETMKHQFLFDVTCITDIEDIPSALIVNWDHTGLKCVPVGQWTMAKEGSTRVAVPGTNDKRPITALFAGTMSGDFLPPQIIYSVIIK